MTSNGQSYDFVIVGGGSAGCVLANRLSEDPKNSVCLLEAGAKDWTPLIHIPLGVMFLIDHKKWNWNYKTEGQSNASNRNINIPRGRALGGSSSINGMVYARGNKRDYDDWANKAGCKGWSYREVLPYFIRSENNETFRDDPLHGTEGPLNVSRLKKPNKMLDLLFESTDAMQIPRRVDFNDGDQEGFGERQVTIKNGRRWSAAKAYLDPVRKRPNLTIMTGALADKVVIESGRATGMEILQGGQRKTISASKEILISCGAIVSPALLMRSGIGAPEELKQHGIDTISAVPGVGKNLQDHVAASIVTKTSSIMGYGISFTAIPKLAWQGLDYIFNRAGMVASNVNEATGYIKTDPSLDRPNIQIGFAPAVRARGGRKLTYGHGYSSNVSLMHPKSKGAITIRDADPASAPVIDPNFLSEEQDLDALVHGIKVARRILGSPAFDKIRGPEMRPGADVKSDEEIAQYVRDNCATVYHPVRTCAMGPDDDPMAVVDTELRVRGVAGLRVVDASVMPLQIGGNTNAPTMMIAEKAADMVLGKSPLPSAVLPEDR
ncbi:MAG TPA: GMC family oxidoreductase [Rhodospirillaceae bacterium]|nr:GMC family oxidoreductase [Rhodospirillaceae bacterium]HAT35346.1 GMC family oxidoreductase [Rhodospirillaceae bacterium]